MLKLLVITVIFYIPLVLSSPCTDFIKTLPVDVKHGFLEVPADWKNPTAINNLKIFYYIKKSLNPNASSILLFNGGPGGTSWRLYQNWIKHPESKEYHGIFMDQRGTGCSTLYPENPPTTQQQAVQLSIFAASSIVEDANALKNYLGIKEKWKIFGQSYGSLLVHRYVQQYPDSISAAYAHGFALTKNMNDYRYLFRKHFINMALEYSKSYPHDLQSLSKIYRKQVADTGCHLKICPYEILPMSFYSLVRIKNNWPKIHDELQALISLAQSQIIIKKVEPLPVYSGPITATGAAVTVIARIDYLRSSKSKFNIQDPYSCQKAMSSLQQEVREPFRMILPSTLFQCEPRFTNAEKIRYFVKDLYHPEYSLKQFGKVLLHSQVKFFLYAAEEDNVSPLTYFLDEIKLLKNKVHFSLVPGGHGDYFENTQFWNDLK